jgi:DNA-binding NarL/FixJ family response regulator
VIRLFIVDRAREMCDIMTKVMAHESDIVVIGSGVSAVEVLPHLDETDVILVTADLPDEGALQLTQLVTERHPATRVIVMDWSWDHTSQESLRQFVTAGLAAYVLEDEPIGHLLETMRTLHHYDPLAAAPSLPALIPGLSHR